MCSSEDPIKASEQTTSDEDYCSGNESDTTSLSSSVLNYEYENGRRYHAYNAGKYVLPNDETEQDRLDMMHHVYSILLGGNLFVAPLKNPQRILDIGTGTGIWAIDAADIFDSAEVIGTDLSPIQPAWVPPNLNFLVDDAEQEWTFSKDSFDFIHVRGMIGSIKDWPTFLKQCFEHLKPGGYIEIIERPKWHLDSDDGTLTPETALYRFYELVDQASRKAGRFLTLDKPFAEMLEGVGFTVTNNTRLKLPLGSWPADKKMKELGLWWGVVARNGFEAYGLALLTRALGMEVDEVKNLTGQCIAEVMGRKVHAYGTMYTMVAQKP